jgi:hypothetical protein
MNLYLNLSSFVPVIFLLILSAMGIVLGDYFAKCWSENHESLYFFAALIGYFLAAVFYIPTLLREQLISAAIICSFLEAFGCLVIGFIIFKEKFNYMELAGIFFGVFSLILFTASNKS